MNMTAPDTDTRLSRMERAIPPLKSTLRVLRDRETHCEVIVASLAASVKALAESTTQVHAETSRALRERDEVVNGLVKTLASSLEAMAEGPVRLLSKDVHETREDLKPLGTTLAEISNTVKKHDAVPERLAQMVGRAFRDCLETGLSALEERTAQMLKASEERILFGLEQRLATIEGKLDTLSGGTLPSNPLVKLEDWMHLAGTQADGVCW
jgi:chromosome segregation ATPase